MIRIFGDHAMTLIARSDVACLPTWEVARLFEQAMYLSIEVT
ncbi:hypothetical protein OG512_23340 [Streptomyces sp. NBC_01378]